ncbi:MAG: hypothetical protein HW402_296 [Dehalococcoidales bacterium]|nr:hypothetical protein [Dehalococcoidales bacterium]
MQYKISLEGFEGQDVKVQTSGLFSGPKLLVNGLKASVGKKSGEMILLRNDGKQVQCKWKSRGLGFDIPLLDVEGKIIQVAQPLKWFVWVWCCLPIVLVFVGGMMGSSIGAVATLGNITIFRSDANGFLKFIFTAVVSILAVVVFAFGVALLRSVVGR